MPTEPQHEDTSPRTVKGDSLASERFPRARRVRASADFARVRRLSRGKEGRNAAGALMAVAAARQDPPLATGSRVGFTVSRKVGNAVTRNAVRRRLREQMRRRLPHIVPGWDIVITARVAAAAASYEAVGAELAAHLARIGMLPRMEQPAAER